ncbi:unnamed protein product [Brassica rapa]|uniref:Uncharacterized protein n=1 Tax=Brassica campestris TaxID=3711 RepID=A0A3P6CHI4_BRACM|nr:unnamed protein product [Brassica rapa]VDD17883.1 unnamed protein product [Brassica rapa]
MVVGDERGNRGCEEVEGRSLDSQVNSTSHASQISGYFT